ncbi:MAG: MFS transporter [Armatimonadota bacterium]|nr:MFS transporter [Armatimonadota bacterium]
MRFRTDRNLQLLYGSLALWMLGVALYDGLIPIYARQLGASPVQLGSLFTIKNLGLASGFLIGWLVADRMNRRTLMFVSWFMGLPVPLLLAVAPTYLWLLPGLLLYELTFFALPAIHAYVAERVPADELASAFGAMAAITSIGFLISPALGGVIADRWGIRTVLLIAFALFVVSTVLVLRMERGGPGAVPAGSSGRLTWRDLSPAAPALLLYVGVNFLVQITNPFLPPFLREVRGISLSEIGVLASSQALGAIVLTPIAGRLGDRLGHTPTLVGQLGVHTSGLLLTAYGPAPLLIPAAALRCRAPLATLTQSMIGATAPAAMLGRTFALAGMLGAALSAAGSFAGGFAYRADPAYPLLISVLAAVVMALALLLRPLRRPRPAGAPDAHP